MTTPDARTFATELLARGIEVTLRGNRLYVWPARAYQSLTEDERTFIREHRAELKALAASKVLPETTVTWSATGPVAAPDPPPPPPPPAPPPVSCHYCGRPCVGPEHHAYATLHWNDPSEIARRGKEDTAVMLHTMNRPSYL